MKNAFLITIIALISVGCNTTDVSTPAKTLEVAYQAYTQNDDHLLESVYKNGALRGSLVTEFSQLEASYDSWSLGESDLLTTQKDGFGRAIQKTYKVDIYAKKHDQVDLDKVLSAIIECNIKQPVVAMMAYPTSTIPTHGYSRPMYYGYGYAYTGGSTINEKEKDLKRQYGPQAPYYVNPSQDLKVACSILTIKNVNNKR